MKRIIALLLVLVLFLCSGCSEDQKKGGAPATTPESTPAATTPQEGTLPEDTPTEPTQPAEPFDYVAHCGTYISSESGAFLELSCWEEGLLGVYYVITGSADRMAEIYADVPVSSFVGNKISFQFQDSWGNLGTMELELLENVINGNITITYFEKSAMFDVREGPDVFQWVPIGNGDDPNNPSYSEDPVDPGIPEDNDPPGIKIGDIYFDDIADELPVSVEQIKKDFIANKKNMFFVGNKNTAFDIVHFMPIKCYFYEDSYDTQYCKIYTHVYYSNGAETYDIEYEIAYKYYDVGGWNYDGMFSTTHKKEHIQGTVTQPFLTTGKKAGNFSYYEYPAGLDISYAEIADDILYSDLNAVKLDGKLEYFDITSLEVIKGSYWDDNRQLSLDVVIGFANSKYTGTASIPLHYRNYDLGGWEIIHNSLSEDGIRDHYPTINYEIEFQPIKNEHSDAAFLEEIKKHFTTITLVSKRESKNEYGHLVNEYTYKGVFEKHNYFREEYDVKLIATFDSKWHESAYVKFVKADASKLAGVWEYRVGDSYIRVNIKDIHYNEADNTGKATLLYDVECSGWNSAGYTKKNQQETILVYGRYATGEKYGRPTMRYMDKNICFISVTVGGKSFRVYLTKDKGVYMDDASTELGITEGAFKKIG